MTPMEELREQAAKIAKGIGEEVISTAKECDREWLTPAEEREVQIANRIADAIEAIPLPAPVTLPQAGEVEPRVTQADRDLFKWLIGGVDSEQSQWIDKGMAFTDEVQALARHRLSTPTETPTAAAPDDGLRQAAQKAFAVLAAIEQTPANVWWVNTLDPETDVGEAYLALDAALSTAIGDEGGRA